MKPTLLLALAATASAHGNITFPAARLPGPAMVALCGQPAVDTVLSDGTIALEEVVPASSACNIGLCRGAQFADVPAAHIQSYSPGQVVLVEVALTIPHLGPANLSIVETATNAVVGDILLFFDAYADEAAEELPGNNTAFGVTMPVGKKGEEVVARCGVAGNCVLQWWWLGTGAKQTYESCVDFVMVPAATVAGVAGAGVNADLKRAQAERNRLLVQQGAGGGPGVTAAVEATAAAPEGSFGGIQGSVVGVAELEVAAAVIGGAGANVVAPEGSFGGVQGLAPAPLRSRIVRGRV
jgi:hypothetical protein